MWQHQTEAGYQQLPFCWYFLELIAWILWEWRHNGSDGISNHQPHECLLNCLFRRRSKETTKLHVTGLCEGNSPVTSESPAQMASYAENVSIGWRHHDCILWEFKHWTIIEDSFGENALYTEWHCHQCVYICQWFANANCLFKEFSA